MALSQHGPGIRTVVSFLKFNVRSSSVSRCEVEGVVVAHETAEFRSSPITDETINCFISILPFCNV